MKLMRFFAFLGALNLVGCGVMGSPVPYVDSHPETAKTPTTPSQEKKAE